MVVAVMAGIVKSGGSGGGNGEGDSKSRGSSSSNGHSSNNVCIAGCFVILSRPSATVLIHFALNSFFKY